jgi:hypothetical protein
MNDRRHLRRDEDADKEQSPAPRRERPENSETASIRDLQASAGNRAVAQLLEARNADPVLAPVQREPGGWKPGAKPAENSTMTIPDMKLTMPILSFSQLDRGAGRAKDQSGEVSVTIPLESADARISEAVVTGTQFDTITIALGSRQTFTLHGVVIASIQMGPDMAGLSLSFTSMEFKFDK